MEYSSKLIYEDFDTCNLLRNLMYPKYSDIISGYRKVGPQSRPTNSRQTMTSFSNWCVYVGRPTPPDVLNTADKREIVFLTDARF